MLLYRISCKVRVLQANYMESVTVNRVYVHLNKVSEGVVDVCSFRQEKAAAWTYIIKEEQLLVLSKNMNT